MQRLRRYPAQITNGSSPVERFPQGRWSQEESQRMCPAWMLLLQAYGYAQELGREVWDFAVELPTLRDYGLTGNDFRWLILKGYVQHAYETTSDSDKTVLRTFRSAPKLTFTDASSFVLTEAGADFAREIAGTSDESPIPSLASDRSQNGQGTTAEHPVWDADRRELRLNGSVVKRFKRRAPNQELILAAFEELGWPPRMDNPLPPVADQDSKRRLHDTINSLNRHHEQSSIRFTGDGSGEGIRWGVLPTSPVPSK